MGKIEAIYNFVVALFVMMFFVFNGIRAIGNCDIVIVVLLGVLVAISALWAKWAWNEFRNN